MGRFESANTPRLWLDGRAQALRDHQMIVADTTRDRAREDHMETPEQHGAEKSRNREYRSSPGLGWKSLAE